MGISRPAADKIRQMWLAHKSRKPQGAGFTDAGQPIRVARTTAPHPVGVTQEVILKWGNKGSETDGTTRRDTVLAFNRFVELDEDVEVHIARIGPVWEILSKCSTLTAGECGACVSVGEDVLTVPVTGDVDASTLYRMQAFCGGDLLLFEHDSSLTWIVDDDPFELDCGAGPWSLDFSVVSTGTAAGQVQAFAKDGGATKARWVSDTLWQPCIYVVMKLVEYDNDCPCAPWKPETCLLPVRS